MSCSTLLATFQKIWKITFLAPLFCKVTDVYLKPPQFLCRGGGENK
jgi:hypothetical protein